MIHMYDREVRVVKGITMLTLIFLVGCAGVVPLEQLEADALLSGDWSAVEQRERLIARRNLRSYMRCEPGTIGYCETNNGLEHCRCIDRKIIQSLFVKD